MPSSLSVLVVFITVVVGQSRPSSQPAASRPATSQPAATQAAPPTSQPATNPASRPGAEDLPKTLTLDCGNDVKMELVLIPAGAFTMGSNEYDIAKPPHAVSIGRPFYMGKYEVTNRQYRCFRWEHNPDVFQGQGLDSDEQPVVMASWDDAKAFCQWLSQRSDREVRLPSEAEWEYVARGGSGWEFPWGDSWPPRGRAGNYADQSAKEAFKDWKIIDGYRDGYAVTSPVGQFDANPFGLYDLNGNVWEWCEDVWHKNYAEAPADGTAWTSGENPNLRVLRGAAWNDYDRTPMRSAFRDWHTAGDHSISSGFRVVVSAPSAGTQ